MQEKRVLFSTASPTGDAEGALRKAREIAIDYLVDTPKPTYEGLLAELRKALRLEPIRLGKLQHLKLFPEKNVKLDSGLNGPRRVAEARFGFEGSEVLWRYNPGLNEVFPFRAVFAKASLGFRSQIKGTDLGAFETDARRLANLLQPLLPRLDEPAERFNAMIDPHLQRHAELWFSLDPADADLLAGFSCMRSVRDALEAAKQSRR